MKIIMMVLIVLSPIAIKADKNDWLEVSSYDFSIKMDRRYFSAQPVRKKGEEGCFLRKGVVEALSRVQSALRVEGYSLKLVHCYWPEKRSRQELGKDPCPKLLLQKRHCRGGSVDVVLVDKKGADILSRVSEKDLPKHERIKNGKIYARYLMLMKKEGFLSDSKGGSHFDYFSWKEFPRSFLPISSLKSRKNPK